MRTNILLIAALILLSTAACTGGQTPEFLDGDIIFHEGRSSQAEELKLATKSRYTHMGIIFKKDGRLFVYEAVQPVCVTPLDRFIRRGVNAHYVVKRLKNRDRVLTPVVIARMKSIGKGFLGKNYDSAFLWSDTRIYCSELVWKIYRRGAGIEVGVLQKLRDFDLTHPKVRALVKKRYGAVIPYDETVISPVQMYKSTELLTVYQNN